MVRRRKVGVGHRSGPVAVESRVRPALDEQRNEIPDANTVEVSVGRFDCGHNLLARTICVGGDQTLLNLTDLSSFVCILDGAACVLHGTSLGSKGSHQPTNRTLFMECSRIRTRKVLALPCSRGDDPAATHPHGQNADGTLFSGSDGPRYAPTVRFGSLTSGASIGT